MSFIFLKSLILKVYTELSTSPSFDNSNFVSYSLCNIIKAQSLLPPNKLLHFANFGI